jgi:hypothetical protein
MIVSSHALKLNESYGDGANSPWENARGGGGENITGRAGAPRGGTTGTRNIFMPKKNFGPIAHLTSTGPTYIDIIYSPTPILFSLPSFPQPPVFSSLLQRWPSPRSDCRYQPAPNERSDSHQSTTDS